MGYTLNAFRETSWLSFYIKKDEQLITFLGNGKGGQSLMVRAEPGTPVILGSQAASIVHHLISVRLPTLILTFQESSP